jgi:hypothetical protein
VINQIQETKWKYKREQSYPALFDENHLPYAIASQQIKIPAYVIKQGLVRIDSKSFGVFFILSSNKLSLGTFQLLLNQR